MTHIDFKKGKVLTPSKYHNLITGNLMKSTFNKSTLAIAVATCLTFSHTAMANETSSSIKGQVTGPNGNPAAGTQITIIHIPSGSVKKTTVTNEGNFSSQGLRVGGPYKIIVDSDQYEDQQLDGIYLTLGQDYPVTVSLQTQQMEQIVVSGAPISAQTGSTGPASHFSLEDLESRPAINRDLKDIIRADPRIFIDETNANSINCGGGNPRFNSLTVDGVRMNDNFGLNSSGYPTERMPFSFDSIDQVAVELAPFDVQYGGFTSCNINAVTKSGTNEIHGGLFYDYTNDSMSGDSIEGKKLDTGNYTEKRYGFNVGLPLIEDKLFFFTSYEKLEGAQIFDYIPFADNRIDQATIDRITQISKDNYNYDPGSMIPSLPVEDEKILVKLDWNINDAHRASLVYNYNDGFSLAQSDADSDEIALSNHFYERGAKLESYVASLYSDWTDNFSTEVRVGYSKLDNRQQSLDAASGFGEFRIDTGDIDVYIGPDDSRQSNILNYDNLSLKLGGTYYLEDHELSFGYEREELDVYNLFVQHTEGEYRFSSIDDFENGIARVYYGNASSQNPDDAAGEFAYALNTVYFQDKFELIDYDITITAGLRYDWYTSSDKPTHNQNFEDRYGFSNSQNLDGIDLLQPRLGINWIYNDQLELRGGFGLYSGGNPNVWVSNSYSNDGVRNIQINEKGLQILGDDAVAFNGGGMPGYDIPQSLYDEVGQGSADASANVTDPDFEIPSEWKFSLGGTYITSNDYVFNVDYLYTDKQDSAIIRNIANVQTDTAPDGRPVYNDVLHPRVSDFMLTNVEGSDAYSHVLSLSMNKAFDNGIDLALSYAYTVAKDVSPMTSSVAFSNYHFIAVSDSENPGVTTSNYEIPHRFTLSLGYSHEIFDGYETKFNLFGQAQQTNPYSYTFDRDSGGLGFNDASRQLLYVPEVDDASVVYGPDFDQAAFNNWIESEGLKRGEIQKRNNIDGDWWVTFDLKVEQEFMGFTPDQKGSAYFVIKNIGNLLNDDWGVLKSGSSLQSAVTADIVDGQYVYSSFNNPAGTSVQTEPSLWEMRIGVRYSF